MLEEKSMRNVLYLVDITDSFRATMGTSIDNTLHDHTSKGITRCVWEEYYARAVNGSGSRKFSRSEWENMIGKKGIVKTKNLFN